MKELFLLCIVIASATPVVAAGRFDGGRDPGDLSLGKTKTDTVSRKLPPVSPTLCAFSPEYYLALYPDVAAGLPADPKVRRAAAIKDYITSGAMAGRSPSPFFDPKYYLKHYKDLADLFQGEDKYVRATLHWISWGCREQRQGSPLFDVNYYLSRAPKDVREKTDPEGAVQLFMMKGSDAPSKEFSDARQKLEEKGNRSPSSAQIAEAVQESLDPDCAVATKKALQSTIIAVVIANPFTDAWALGNNIDAAMICGDAILEGLNKKLTQSVGDHEQRQRLSEFQDAINHANAENARVKDLNNAAAERLELRDRSGKKLS